VWLFLLAPLAGCHQKSVGLERQETRSLRVGVGRVPSTPDAGLAQVRQILTTEALVNFSADGRPHPWLADGWVSDDRGRSMTIRLRSDVQFHDGSAVDADTVAKMLRESLPGTMGPAFQDIESIRDLDPRHVQFLLRRPSPFVLEALVQQPIRKSGNARAGTGPFVDAAGDGTNEIRANSTYYLGRPSIDRVVLNTYPSIRAAWADLLRDRLDMLYEVGTDALDSLENAKQISVFKYTRSYQFVVVFNRDAPVFRSSTVRRALNLAIDRSALLDDAFEGRAERSGGPVSPRHWAYASDPSFTYDPRKATELLRSTPGARTLRFTCVVPPDSERIALIVKRQLQAIGVEMDVRELGPDEFLQALKAHKFEAALTEFLSGPTLFDVYSLWHSESPSIGRLGGPLLDAALDRVRHASNDEEYRDGVAAVQRAVVDDPPGIFLAWSQRARAVSRRFDIPPPEDRDILRTLRLWRPSGHAHSARN
jgi:peptide/nickel transport system substrate-binding protein